MTSPADSGAAAAVPELGPSLGRMTDGRMTEPPARGAANAGGRSAGAALDDLRLELVSRLFDLAGAARQFAAADDLEGAARSLGRVAWLGAWERTVTAAAARLADTVNAGFRSAAAESRLPRRRLELLLLTPDDAHSIAARLGAGAADFVAALDAAEAEAAGRRWGPWRDAVGAAARRLESAWIALEDAYAVEDARWRREVERVLAWRRPAWPLVAASAGILGTATYLGLVLGGYVPVPGFLRGVADAVWSLGWI